MGSPLCEGREPWASLVAEFVNAVRGRSLGEREGGCAAEWARARQNERAVGEPVSESEASQRRSASAESGDVPGHPCRGA